MKINTFIKNVLQTNETYFIAEIGSNFDGNYDRAIKLIDLAVKAGADAVKFQHYTASSIVSDNGFKSLSAMSHQKKWSRSVYDTYDDASLNKDWTKGLYDYSTSQGIDFLTSPYSIELIDFVDEYIPAYKIGSGDISWIDAIHTICKKGKPVMLATGASSMEDVVRAVEIINSYSLPLILMQCNTNYSGSIDEIEFANLNVLKKYKELYPNAILGLSDHTPGNLTVLGSYALGCRVFEKHFTDDKSRIGPDHSFAMDFDDFSQMVAQTKLLSKALGDGEKKIEENEKDTYIVQRRSIHAKIDIKKGKVISEEDLDILRPCPRGSFHPFEKDQIIGKTAKINIKKGETLFRENF